MTGKPKTYIVNVRLTAEEHAKLEAFLASEDAMIQPYLYSSYQRRMNKSEAVREALNRYLDQLRIPATTKPRRRRVAGAGKADR